MNWPLEKPLEDGMRSNPVIEVARVALPSGVVRPNNAQLGKIVPGLDHSLTTWGSRLGDNLREVHWIGERFQGPLRFHTDSLRYSHQLIIRSDGFVFRGQNKIQTPPLFRGTYIVIDTHSPHQLFEVKDDSWWYVAAATDSPNIELSDVIIPLLIDFTCHSSIGNTTE